MTGAFGHPQGGKYERQPSPGSVPFRPVLFCLLTNLVPGQEPNDPALEDRDAGPIFDFDGDGEVLSHEVQYYELWFKDSGLQAAGLEEALRYPNGVVDLYSFLAGLETATAHLVRGAQSGGCDQTWICCFIRGDANRDWVVNISDVMAINGFLFGGGDPPLSFDAADANDDGVVNMADVIYLLGFLFSGGPPPPPPFRSGDPPAYAPGGDPTYDLLELPCQDAGDYEHARNPLETREIAVPPREIPPS
jgi:hypothetical protein